MFFFGFFSFLCFFTAVASLSYSSSLLLFIFTNRWSTVHHTWGTVLRHVRVPSSSSLLGGKLDGAVADGTVLDMEHLASRGTRQGPCALVIMISLYDWAPGSVSQFKLLLQKS